MKKPPKISVIVPVYNEENYLDKCIQSILNQSFTDFELLLINDGSSDSSATICDGYTVKDNRVRVFHKENGGVSLARNLGLEHATGEWITFVDGDDYISEKYFNPILDYNNQDFILLSREKFRNGQTTSSVNFEPQRMNFESFIKKYKIHPYYSLIAGKIYKNSIIKSKGIFFEPNMKYGEDTIFNIQYLFHCENIAVTNRSIYFYRDVEGSLSKDLYNYKKMKTLYTLTNKELKNFSKEYRDTNIKYSLHLLLKALYSDKTIDALARRKKLKELMASEYDSIQILFGRGRIRHFFRIAKALGVYNLLDIVLLKKLGDN